MKSTKIGVNCNAPVHSSTGAKRIPLDIATRDYVMEKYHGLPEQELKFILHPYFQYQLKNGD